VRVRGHQGGGALAVLVSQESASQKSNAYECLLSHVHYAAAASCNTLARAPEQGREAPEAAGWLAQGRRP
jgi:hypothetical protein